MNFDLKNSSLFVSNVNLPTEAKTQPPVDNIELRFQSLYDIISKSWVQDAFVEKNSDIDFSPTNDKKYIKNLSKKFTNGSIPTEAPVGFKFCLAGAAMYIGGPTEEEITTSLALACALNSGINNIKEIFDTGYMNFIQIDDEENLTLVTIGRKTSSFCKHRYDNLLVDIFDEGMKHVSYNESDAFLSAIYDFNDYSEHKDVLKVIKKAQSLYKIIQNIKGGQKYSQSKLNKALFLKN